VWRRIGRVLRQPLLAGLLLGGVYLLLSFAMSPRGYLGTDTGAKVATLDVMVTRGQWQPGIGYWAEDHDPTGRLHPILDARPSDGDWVHVTTLPMLLLGRPLYAAGGYRLALLLPMAGAIAAAFASRSIARRAVSTADEGVGWTAFWVVGLASPIAVYALDFWEHAPGVACMVGAVALLAAILDGSRHRGWAVAAGALLGASATMRTETFVYALVAVGLACAALLWTSRSLWPPTAVGALAVAGFAAPWFGNVLLERALGGNDRGARVAGATRGAAVADLAHRAREAWTTLLALRPADRSELAGLLFAALVVAALVYSRRSKERVAAGLLVVAGALQGLAILSGLNFVPGMLVAAPIAVVGVVWWPRAGSVGARYSLAVAVTSLPLVWLFQFLGGAGPQWAGRYALSSCILLVALGVAALHRSDSRVLAVGLIGLSALVTTSGVLWLAERSHAVDDYFEMLVRRPEDVVVVRNGFFVREGGPAYGERRWLTAVTDADLRAAVVVVAAAGERSFAVLDDRVTAPDAIGPARLVSTDRTTLVGTDLYLHSYQLPDRTNISS
jgi:hypothetical protein